MLFRSEGVSAGGPEPDARRVNVWQRQPAAAGRPTRPPSRRPGARLDGRSGQPGPVLQHGQGVRHVVEQDEPRYVDELASPPVARSEAPAHRTIETANPADALYEKAVALVLPDSHAKHFR